MLFRIIWTKLSNMSWLSFLLLVTGYYVVVLNYPILRHFYQILANLDDYNIWFAISIPFVLFSLLLIIFTLFSFKYILKPIFFMLLSTSGIVFYAALRYNILFDQDMIQNIFESNTREAISSSKIATFGIFTIGFGGSICKPESKSSNCLEVISLASLVVLGHCMLPFSKRLYIRVKPSPSQMTTLSLLDLPPQKRKAVLS